MSQGDGKTSTKGTESLFVMNPDDIQNIPKYRTVTYAWMVVDYGQQKCDPNRVRMTAGGNLIKYPGDITTRTADITTLKNMLNSVLSTDGAKYMCIDIKNFYLCAPLDWFEYMHIPLSMFTEHIIQQYHLIGKEKNRFIYVEIRKGIYGLP